MAHTPFGYDIVDGRAVINEKNAEQIRKIYRNYIAGDALKVAAEKAGCERFHSSVGRMLKNEVYLGTEYYPAIIDKETFTAAALERLKRAKALGRIYEYEDKPIHKKKYKYSIGPVKRKFNDPFKQAEYAYSKISEEELDG